MVFLKFQKQISSVTATNEVVKNLSYIENYRCNRIAVQDRRNPTD